MCYSYNKFNYKTQYKTKPKKAIISFFSLVLFQLEDTYEYYIQENRYNGYAQSLTSMIPAELRPVSLQFTAEDFGTEMTFQLACVAKGGNAGKVDRLVNEMVLAIKTRLSLTTKLLKAYNSMKSY